MKASHLFIAITILATPLSAQSPFLGVELNAGDSSGLEIVGITPNSAAQAMGIQPGDVLLAINKQKASELEALGELIGSRRPGEYMTVMVRREGKVLNLNGNMGMREGESGTPGTGFLGITLEGDEDPGVSVLEIFPNTAAQAMALAPGDRILAINNQKVTGTDGLIGVLSALSAGSFVEVMVRSNGQVKNVQGILGIRPPEAQVAIEEAMPDAEVGMDVEEIVSSFDDLDIAPDGVSKMKFAFPEDIPESQRDQLIKQLQDQFGEDVEIVFGMDDMIFEEVVEEPVLIEDSVFEGAVEEPVLSGRIIAEASATGGTWHENLETAVSSSKRSGKPVLVDFYADWCGPCKRQKKEVLANPEYADLMSRFELVGINVDNHGELAEKYGVQGIPDVRILNSDGKQVERYVGYGGVEGTVSQLRGAVEKHTRAAAAMGPSTPQQSGGGADVDARRTALQQRIRQVEAEIEAIRAELQRIQGGGGQ